MDSRCACLGERARKREIGEGGFDLRLGERASEREIGDGGLDLRPSD